MAKSYMDRHRNSRKHWEVWGTKGAQHPWLWSANAESAEFDALSSDHLQVFHLAFLPSGGRHESRKVTRWHAVAITFRYGGTANQRASKPRSGVSAILRNVFSTLCQFFYVDHLVSLPKPLEYESFGFRVMLIVGIVCRRIETDEKISWTEHPLLESNINMPLSADSLA